MPLGQLIAPHLPSLRRYARAVSGSQQTGDAHVIALLEALVQNSSIFPTSLPPKVALYRLFSQIWNSVEVNVFPDSREKTKVLLGLQTLTPKPRQAFLLLSVEGFEPEEITLILQVGMAEVAALIEAVDEEIAMQLAPANILIIEDEPVTALHLEELVESLGHNVVEKTDLDLGGIGGEEREISPLAVPTRPEQKGRTFADLAIRGPKPCRPRCSRPKIFETI
jgi:DNA-directed RNA polymerase specialized sigma24 family protein